jgi:hypothetical protein
LGFREIFLILRITINIGTVGIIFGTVFADTRLRVGVVAGLGLLQIYVYSAKGVIPAGNHRHIAQICAEFTLKLVLVGMFSIFKHNNVLVNHVFDVSGLFFTS